MKPKLLDSIIFLLITPLTISTTILLFLTFLSTMNFSDKDINPKEDAIRNMSPEQFREQQRINLIETDLEIFKINEGINEAEILIEDKESKR